MPELGPGTEARNEARRIAIANGGAVIGWQRSKGRWSITIRVPFKGGRKVITRKLSQGVR